MLVSIYLAMQKHSCIKLDLERGALINPSMVEVGHSGSVPGELVTSEEGISKRLKGLERKPLGGELLARIMFAGKKGFRMGFPPGQRGSAKHAKGLVSVPWKPDSMEETGSKAGRRGNHNWHEGKLRVPGMRCQQGLPGRVERGDIEFALCLSESLRLSPPGDTSLAPPI